MKLIEFVVCKECKEKHSRFRIDGIYSFEQRSEDHDYLEFEELTAYRFENGEFKEYTPESVNWYGQVSTEEDMFLDVLSAETRGDLAYEITFIEQGIKIIADHYKNDTLTVSDGSKLPKHILGADGELYELSIATNKYLFYVQGDQSIMLSTDDRSVISDNYFAEVGWHDSMINVLTGKEQLLFGNVPEDFEI